MAIFKQKEEEQTAVDKSQPGILTKVPMVLVQPRISEKSGHLAAVGKYVFNVKKSANKVEIKKAVERAYKVTVVKVNIINTEGKTKNSGRHSGRTSDFKKAVVSLKKGDKIEGATDIN